jgi:hypothetical protein
MDGARLEILVENMPTLQFLLFGHPNMQSKTVGKVNDGSVLLEIDPALGVSKSSFVLLLNCLFRAQSLPPRSGGNSRRDELVETIATLGGCASLERRLREQGENPLTPAEDTTGAYCWSVVEKYRTDQLDQYTSRDMRREGYSYTAWEKDKEFGINRHYFRRSKKDQAPASGPARAQTDLSDATNYAEYYNYLLSTLQASGRNGGNH